MVLALGRLAIGGLLLSAISLAPSAPVSTQINSRPLIPSTRLEFGIASHPSDLSWMASSGVPWNYRYTYLDAGVSVRPAARPLRICAESVARHPCVAVGERL